MVVPFSQKDIGYRWQGISNISFPFYGISKATTNFPDVKTNMLKSFLSLKKNQFLCLALVILEPFLPALFQIPLAVPLHLTPVFFICLLSKHYCYQEPYAIYFGCSSISVDHHLSHSCGFCFHSYPQISDFQVCISSPHFSLRFWVFINRMSEWKNSHWMWGWVEMPNEHTSTQHFLYPGTTGVKSLKITDYGKIMWTWCVFSIHIPLLFHDYHFQYTYFYNA